MRPVLAAALCTVALLGLSSTAESGAILQLSTDAAFGPLQTLTINDGDPGDLAGAGAILTTGAFGGFAYTFSSDTVLTVQAVAGAANETLYARFTDTGINSPLGSPATIGRLGSSRAVDPTGIGVSFRSYTDSANGVFGNAFAQPSQNCGRLTDCDNDAIASGLVREHFNVGTTLGNETGAVFNTSTPEPGSLLLLASGLAGLAAAVARRRRAKQPQA
jgi:hypothetical protein